MQAKNLYATQIGPELYSKRSRDSAGGVAAGYKLDNQGVGVRAPVFSRIFSSPHRPDRFWDPPSYPIGTVGSFFGAKGTAA
jgi:hypothetical protein